MAEVTEVDDHRVGDDGGQSRRNLMSRVGLALAVLALIAAGYFVGRSVNDDGVSAAGTTEPPAATSSSDSPSPTESAMNSEPPPDDTVEPPEQVGPTGATATPIIPAPSAGVVEHGPLAEGAAVQVTSTQWIAGTASIEVVAAVTGIATESGSCTVVAVLGDLTATKEYPAFFDGKGTSCGVMQLPLTDRRPGAWSVTVVFDSPSGAAVAEPAWVHVP